MDQIGQFYRKQFEANKGKLKHRSKELIQAAERLENWFQRRIDPSVQTIMCIERFDSMLTSYSYDVIRYKSFHGMLDPGKESNINFPKIYAYTTKWILKEKPIYLTCDDVDDWKESETKKLADYLYFANVINELWALTWIKSSYLAQTGEKLNLKKHSKQEQGDGLLYVLKYRDFSVAIFEEFLCTMVNHEILEQL